mmetsp:Transcript_3772/g.8314  ORF Transcript_3772/g.8314 Transcript_3772/m.8314 type:complete len:92 (-) Transcript_3772:2035-2310(-)
MGLKEVFDEAAAKVKEVSGLSNDDLLELYSNFKQATVGDCNIDRPGGFFNHKEQKKWDAWNAKKGVSADEAMKAYIAKVDSVAGTDFGTKI